VFDNGAERHGRQICQAAGDDDDPEQEPNKLRAAGWQRERGCDQDHENEVKHLAHLVRAMPSHVQPNFSRALQGH
jgi:hypothetical protein